MKKPTDQPGLQLNLPLPNDPATAIPADKQKELAMALIELLISELRRASPTTGGGDESEVDC